jgi:serine/threonine protein kinase
VQSELQGVPIRYEPGCVLAERYRLESVLGSGGMGIVHAAYDLTREEAVAIKLLRPELRSRGRALMRFERESRAVAEITSPHVVRVRDAGLLDDGTPYLVMERLIGRSIAAEVADRGRLPVGEAMRYVAEAARGAAAAHRAGIVHRDLKPANLFLAEGPEGPTVKVVDFGISKLAAELALTVTATNSSLGTPGYMSPEQLRSAKYVDARSDVWALGVIAYELLVCELPFRGATTSAVAAAITTRDPIPPSSIVTDLPRGLEEVLLKALAKDPEQRHASADELADALVVFATGVPEPAELRLPRKTEPASTVEPPQLSEFDLPQPGSTHLDGSSIAFEPPSAADRAAAAPAVRSSESARLLRWLLMGITLGVLVSLLYATLR